MFQRSVWILSYNFMPGYHVSTFCFEFILGGSLIFDEKEVELIADNILITEGGLLQVRS